MSQHDFNIDNQNFPATRADINDAILAIVSNSSGDTEPSTTYANQWWYETDTNILKIRNEANDGWVDVITLDANMTASASELSQLDAITRGSIIYGNASGATARLAAGAASTVLTSDGTDISWAASGGGVPTGSIMPHTTATEPTGWLECDGAEISRSTYATLFGVISDDYGNGNGSTTFNLPDLRGQFLRGFANGSANDPDRASRTDRGDGTTGDVVGSKQADEVKSHRHRHHATATGSNYSSSVTNLYPGHSYNDFMTSSTPNSGWGGYTGGNETRPTNVQLMYCIKT